MHKTMKNKPTHHLWVIYGIISVFVFLLSFTAKADTINIVDDVYTYTSLTGDVVNMSGVSELHITDATTPISGCTINLNSTDSFFFLENIKPSVANSTYLSQVKVSGANAVLNTNVRVVEYAAGAVIIPQSSTFQPLQVFSDENFQGSSAKLNQYTQYNNSSLGTMANNISSFILKRGYTATFAQNENGTGYSKNYVAQDCDLEIGVLPTKLNDTISFVRVFPWRWTSKKGICGNIGSNLNIKWWYNWNIDQNSSLDKEYVPIRQERWWPSLSQNWQTRGASHLLGYNEPDSSEQADITVGDAIWSWPDLLATGLRVGSPATTDGGRSSWLYPFIEAADDADLRVDFVAVHYYWCYNPSNPSGAATQMYNYLKAVHDTTGRPIWVTEWNNGANWTECGDPTYAQQAACVGAMIDMLDSTSWVERYAIYNWVEDCRRVEWDDGWPTEAGEVYRDQVSPVGYQQEVHGSGKSSNAIYTFDTDFRDSSGNGNNPLSYGAPKIVAGHDGNAISLDGTDDYLVLPTHMGEDADFTFAAWVYWDGGSSFQRIFDFGNSTTTGYMYLTPSSSAGKLRFSITASGSGSAQNIETTQLATGQWVHVAVTLSGNTGKLYVNGSPAETTSISINPSDFNPAINYIGKSQWSADPLFDGMLDNVMIAGYALDDNEINTLYTTNQPADFAKAPLDIVGVVAGAEETGNPAVNSYDRNRDTRWANDGTVPNAWIKYDLGTTYEVDRIKLKLNVGASRTYPLAIDIDGVPVFNGNTSTTSGYWDITFNPTIGRYVTITMTGNNSSGNGWFSIFEASIWELVGSDIVPPAIPVNLSASLYDSAINLDWDDNTEPDFNSYNVYRSTSAGGPYTKIDTNVPTSDYADSNFADETKYYYAVTAVDNLLNESDKSDDTTAYHFSGDFSFDGFVDMFDMAELGSGWQSVYDINELAELSEDWLKEIHWIAYLPLDGDANDITWNQLEGVCYDNVGWTSSGHIDGAVELYGPGDSGYIRFPGFYGVTGTGSRTCCAWIKTGVNQCHILTWGTSGSGNSWIVQTDLLGKLRVDVGGGGYIKGNTTVINDAWHHIAAVLADDGSPNVDEVQLYVDGQPQTTSSVSQSINTAAGGDVRIGVFSSDPLYFNGLIDDIRIYDRALSQKEIQKLAE
ncbi:MAG: discoidin domain-containing protein [Sedimentisphaerales bacterium]|nr:discoidin domain-containing protein [Sedimentisphaerales bacterium]